MMVIPASSASAQQLNRVNLDADLVTVIVILTRHRDFP
jgi:hypothetical protein